MKFLKTVQDTFRSQHGFAHLALVLLLLAGLGIGVFLVGQRTNILPHAQEDASIIPQTAFHLQIADKYGIYRILPVGEPDNNLQSNESSNTGEMMRPPNKNWFYPDMLVAVDVALSTDLEYTNVFNANISFPPDMLEVSQILVNGRSKSLKLDKILAGLFVASNKEDFAKQNQLSLEKDKIRVWIKLNKNIVHIKAPTFEDLDFEIQSQKEDMIEGLVPIGMLSTLAESIDVDSIGAISSNSNYQADTTSTGPKPSKKPRVAGRQTKIDLPIVCAQVITKACKIQNNCVPRPGRVCVAGGPEICKDFPTPCDVPKGWYIPEASKSADICKTGINGFELSNPCEGGYRNVTFECYDGWKVTEGDATSCKDPESWKVYAEWSCMGRSSCPVPSTCIPRPDCLDSNPACQIAITDNFCPTEPEKVRDYFINFWIEQKYDNPSGTISLIGGVPKKGIKTIPGSKPIMATIIFKTKKSGFAEVRFNDISEVLSVEAGKNILTAKNPIKIEIKDKSVPVILGDINGDGLVGFKDFSYLLTKWGTDDKTADINGDGKVNLNDFSIMLAHWGGRKGR